MVVRVFDRNDWWLTKPMVRASSSAICDSIQPVIPRKRNQKRGRPHNAALYRERNIIERFFCRLKHFRAVATRYDKRATTYLATVLLATIVLCL